MRKVLFVLIIGLLWNATPADAQTSNGKGAADLRGAVKVVRHELAEFTSRGDKSVAGRRTPVQAVAYDAKGNKVEQVGYNQDGSVALRLVYTYDAGGRNTGYEEYAGGSGNPRRHVYAFDEKGQRSEYRIVQPDGSGGEKHLYKYDARGRLLEESLQGHKGELISRNVYAYDGEDRQVSQTRYNADGSLSSTTSISYDERGKPAERVRFEGDTLTYRVRYVYDRKGRVIGQETTGSVVESDVPHGEAHPPGRVVYVYKGGAQQPRELIAYAPDGTVRERVLIEHDARGNWIKKTYLVQPVKGGRWESQRVEYRTITYFNAGLQK
jgi:YD repeat-containing protein